MPPPAATIYALPTELIGVIIKAWHILDPCAPEIAIQICRSWRSIALSMTALWRVLTLTTQKSSLVKVPLWNKRSCGHVEHLRLMSTVVPKGLSALGTALDDLNLGEISTLECNLIEWVRHDVFKRITRLQRFRVATIGYAVHLWWDIVSAMENLRMLDLVNAYPQDDRALHLPNLRVVRFQSPEGAYLIRFLLKTCAGIPLEEATLSLKHSRDKAITQPSDRDLANMGSSRVDYSHLRYLRLSGTMDWHLLTARLFLPELHTLIMDHFPSPSLTACFGDIRPLDARVRSLTVHTQDHLAIEEGLSILIQLEGVPTLQHLRICGYLSDTFLDGLSDGCQPHLVHIDLSGCEGVSPAAVVRLAVGKIENGNPLRRITLNGCQWVTEDLVSVLKDMGLVVDFEHGIVPLVPQGWRHWTFVNT